MSLWAEFLTHDGRNINKWTHYFPVYERHLERFRNQAVTMIEIGCGRGGSLQLWKRHLGPHARIVGVDILERAKRYEEHQIHVRIGDQSDTQFLQSLIDEFGAPEIVLDDGSHIASHMVSTFQFLYPKTAPTGVYMVEDLHANYSSEFGGGYLRPGTFVELCKTFVDGITAIGSDKVPHDPLIGETLSMHIYEKIAVFEKGRHEPAISLRKGGEPAGPSSSDAA